MTNQTIDLVQNFVEFFYRKLEVQADEINTRAPGEVMQIDRFFTEVFEDFVNDRLSSWTKS